MKIAELLMREDLPQREFFNISEVCSLLNVKPHDIRYWEAEFPQAHALRIKSGQRIYSREDLVRFFTINYLLHDKKFTVAGVGHILTQSGEFFSNNKSKARERNPIEVNNVSCDKDLVQQKNEREELSRDNDLILTSASSLLDDDEEEEFDMLTHQIYQQCAKDLAKINPNIEPAQVDEMLCGIIVKNQQEERRVEHLSKLEYKKTLAILMESKNSLVEVLAMLDKYQKSTLIPEDYPRI